MDPYQTWADMFDALKRKQWDEAKELADCLYEWICNGGFPPSTVGNKSPGKNWHRTVAAFTCLTVADEVDDIPKRIAPDHS